MKELKNPVEAAEKRTNGEWLRGLYQTVNQSMKHTYLLNKSRAKAR
jgi:hypothetical protein